MSDGSPTEDVPPKIYCAVGNCGREAHAEYEMGSLSQRWPLCRVCGMEVWRRFKGAVGAGLMHFVMRPLRQVPSDPGEKI